MMLLMLSCEISITCVVVSYPIVNYHTKTTIAFVTKRVIFVTRRTGCHVTTQLEQVDTRL
jgi:hypothetical protein